MEIVLNNGITLMPVMVTGEEREINGIKRDTLTFVFKDISLTEADSLFTEDNLKSVIIRGEDGSEAVYKGYCLRQELVKKEVEVKAENAQESAVYESRIMVTMASLSFTEAKLMAIAEESADTQLAVAELAEIIMGGDM